MDETRRNILRKASALSALAVGASGVAAGADCSGVSEWDAGDTYNGGDQVTYDGALWTAEWWTRSEPTESTAVWTRNGPCSGSGGSDGGNSDDGSSGGNGPCSGVSAWSAGTTYIGGDRATFDGSLWEANWWTQGDEPGSSQWGPWAEVGTCDSGNNGGDGGSDDGSDGGSGDSDEEDDIFAPYQGTWGDVVGATEAASTDRVVLSFLGDATSGDGVNPGWLTADGQRPLSDFTSQIQQLQDQGVEVWVAIGGWDGRTVARDATDATELKNVYANIVDTLGVTHLDIDDENANEVGRDGTVYQIRNEALAMLQDERPEVKVTYTVPAGRNGIENRNYSPARDMVSDAVSQGVDLSYVNIMTMNFSASDYASIIQSAGQGTVDWLANVYPNKSEAERFEMLGVTPNVGENNFTADDAQGVVDWAEQEDLGMLSFWALYKSSATAQSEIFYQFENDED